MLNAMIVGSRFLQFSGALVLLGSSLFCLYGVEGSPVPERRRSSRRVLTISALTAAAGTVLWVMAETALFSGDINEAVDRSAVWFVFSETRFGRAALWRVGLLVLAALTTRFIRRPRVLWSVTVVLGTAVIATFAWTGHGAMQSGWTGALHVGGDIVHLWVAGVWLGALVPLATAVASALRTQNRDDVRAACYGLDRFSSIGSLVVATLALTGLINSWFLIGVANWFAAFKTPYGVTLLIKLALFAAMLSLAALNRFRFAPELRSSLEGGHDETTLAPLRALMKSVSLETSLAALVLLSVAVLGTLAPPSASE
jgi:putative copper resistance protein D